MVLFWKIFEREMLISTQHTKFVSIYVEIRSYSLKISLVQTKADKEWRVGMSGLIKRGGNMS